MADSTHPVTELEGLFPISSRVQQHDAWRAWWTRHFDETGVPLDLSIHDWREILLTLEKRGAVAQFFGDDFEGARASVEQLLRRARPDGSAFFAEKAEARTRLDEFRRLATWAGSEQAATVLGWWSPRTTEHSGSPPLPSDHGSDCVFSVLRPDWNRQGHWIGIDHRSRSSDSRVELGIGGTNFLGPNWTSSPSSGRGAVPSLVHAKSGPFGDLVEWSLRIGGYRHTRTAVLLRGRDLALFAEQIDGGPDRTMRLDMTPSGQAEPVAADGSMGVKVPRRPRPIQLLPLACSRGQTLSVEPSGLSLSESPTSARSWLPLLVNWGRAPSVWKPLTVSERSKVCPGHVAFAARLAWGREPEGLLIYRSLTKPALRAVFGLQTRAKFLVGRYTREGRVIPIVSIDS